MKKVLLILLLSYMSIKANSQLVKNEISKEVSIGVEKRGFMKFAELTYIAYSSPIDTLYHLYYKDENFKQINEWKSMFFKGGGFYN